MDHEAGQLTECCELLNTISAYPENKKCFDCTDNHSPRYLCTTYSTFVCSCCATIHQEFGHKIKVLSVFAFTFDEIYVLKETGNKVAADKWLARWRSDLFNEPDPSSPTYKEDAREYMRAKYIDKKWVKAPPRIPLGELPRGKGASVSPRGIAEVSPRRSGAEVSPRYNNMEVSPRDYNMEVSPRDYNMEVSPRKDGADADMLYEERSISQQQHDAEKLSAHPSLRDAPYPQPPVVYQYVTQPMYIPMSFPPGPYGYPQYSVPMEMSQLPCYGLPHKLCSYPFDNSHFTEGVSWPGANRREKISTPSTSQKQLLRPQPAVNDVQPTGILRSVSDTSLNARQVLTEECTGACKCSTCAAASQTVSKKQEAKLKIQGVMSKVTGLLAPKRN